MTDRTLDIERRLDRLRYAVLLMFVAVGGLAFSTLYFAYWRDELVIGDVRIDGHGITVGANDPTRGVRISDHIVVYHKGQGVLQMKASELRGYNVDAPDAGAFALGYWEGRAYLRFNDGRSDPKSMVDIAAGSQESAIILRSAGQPAERVVTRPL